MAFQPCVNKNCNSFKSGELGNCDSLFPSDFMKCHKFKSEMQATISENDILKERMKLNARKPVKKPITKPVIEKRAA